MGKHGDSAPGTCWLTGASRGIGRALARDLAQRGWHVVASARDGEALAELAGAAPGPGRITALPVDVSDRAATAQACAHAIDHAGGRLDRVIANAGIFRGDGSADFDAATLAELTSVNLQGCANVVAPALAHMRAQGRGQVALMGSLAGYRGLPGMTSYGTSKAAVIHLAESLRADAPAGVDVKLINPGYVATDGAHAVSLPQFLQVDVAEAARRIADGLGRPDFEIVFPNRVATWLGMAKRLPYHEYFPLIRRVMRVAQPRPGGESRQDA